MNKYERVPDEIIDLHGHTKKEAENILIELVKERAPKHIRIITGKGLYRENGPVLRTFVKNFLNDHGLRYIQSKIENGGEGALEVFF